MGRIPDRKEVETILKSRLSPGLLDHCLRTEELAVELARRNGVNVADISIAALLHDYGKSVGKDRMIDEAEGLGIEITDADRSAPFLLHAPVGAAMANKDFDLPQDIALAIKAHTYGRPGMTKFDKIIYLADGVEPGRNNTVLDRIRDEAFEDIDRAFKELFAFTLKKLIDGGSVVHPVTIEVWNSLAV